MKLEHQTTGRAARGSEHAARAALTSPCRSGTAGAQNMKCIPILLGGSRATLLFLFWCIALFSYTNPAIPMSLVCRCAGHTGKADALQTLSSKEYFSFFVPSCFAHVVATRLRLNREAF